MKLNTKQLIVSAMALGMGVVASQAQALVVNGLTVTNDTGPIAATVVTPGAGGGSATGFDIVLNYTAGAPGGATQTAFENAEATWESLITGYKEAYPLAQITIDVNLGPIDGPGFILGSAGPTGGFSLPTYLYASQGEMTFDTADIPGLGSALESVVLHEMGHVLGIGTLWSASTATGGGIPFGTNQELYVTNSGQYTGTFGLAAYNSEFSQAGGFVPVELGGGGGTANGHWNEVEGGAGPTGIVSNIEPGPFNDMQNELMTGWLNEPSFISTLTIEGMQDLGYDVVPEPTSLALLGLGGLLVARRRRRG